ncbi:MAG: SGNH/GDSL hydrolase family protein, partial [Rickettsiales bacterium]|nr:SGNH/GDSL hydrolase family protein [Rickettsiales bacterium]
IYAGADNQLNLSGVAAFQGPDTYLEIKTRYEQTGTTDHATQATQANRPWLLTGLLTNGQYGATVHGTAASTTQRMTYPSTVTGDSRNFSRLDTYHYQATAWGALWLLGANSFTAGNVCYFPGNNGAKDSGYRAHAVVGNPTARVAGTSRSRSQPQVATVVGGSSNMKLFQDDTLYTLSAASAGTFTAATDYYVDSTYKYQGLHFDTLLWAGQLTDADVRILHRYFYALYNVQTYADAQLVWGGNSLTQGLRVTNLNNMQRQMEPLLKRRIHISNQGVSGQTLATMETNVAYYQGQFRSDLSKNLFIAIDPTNDIDALASGSIVGAGLTLYNRLVNVATAMTGSGFIMAAPTCVSRLWTGGTTDRTQKDAERVDYNTRLKTNASSLGITVLDYDAQTESQTPTNGTYFYSDQLHWNAALCTVFAPMVASWVNANI